MSLLLLTLAPSAAIILLVYFKDKYEKEPWKQLFRAFAFGGLSVIPAVILELILEKMGMDGKGGIVSIASSAFLGVAAVEELCKFYFLRKYFYNHPDLNEPYDAIVYSVMISMGFATLENVFYVVQGGMGVAILRMFTAVPAHATFAVLMGYFMGVAKFMNQPGKVTVGVVMAILFHGAYDFCLFARNIPGMAFGALFSLIAGAFFSWRALKLHSAQSPFRNDGNEKPQ